MTMNHGTSKLVSVILLFVFGSSAIFYDFAIAGEEIDKYKKMGMKAIADFYDPFSSHYFGKKVKAFFSDDNLKRLKQLAEKRGRTSEEQLNALMQEEFAEFVTGDLVIRLRNISEAFIADCGIKTKLNIDVSKLAIARATTVGFGAAIGLSAIMIVAFTMITAEITAMWAAALVLLTEGLGIGAVIAGLISGPWGWAILGSIAVAGICGVGYYQKTLKENRDKAIEKVTVEIKNKRAELENKWEMLFME